MPAENNVYDVHASHSVGTPHTPTVVSNAKNKHGTKDIHSFNFSSSHFNWL